MNPMTPFFPGYALIYHNGGIYMDTDFLAIDMSSIIDPQIIQIDLAIANKQWDRV